MADPKMHADELDIDANLVRRLLRAQFPKWEDLAVSRVPDAGTDNALYRLGEDMVVRLPRREHNVVGLEKERVWLPRLAPFLPLAVPVPLEIDEPGEGYPLEWARLHRDAANVRASSRSYFRSHRPPRLRRRRPGGRRRPNRPSSEGYLLEARNTTP